jgi:hypothetical protein
MSDDTEGRMRLADFLADLRDELSLARERASGPLKLGVDEITITVDVAYSKENSQKVGGRARASFWAVFSAELSGEAARTTGLSRTHTLTLTLNPRIEEITVDENGDQRVVIRTLDVAGVITTNEENPDLPPLSSRSGVDRNRASG